jgi:ABC-type transport system involved in multi-copper enzyme maturation permease subunit
MAWKRRIELNPIIVKELRSRMRGWRAFAVLTAVLVLLGGASYGLYRVVLSTSRYSNTPLSPQIGQALFIGLAFMELLMVCFVTPAITSGAISSEKESQTYEMLLATSLPPGRILRGKLISALSYVGLLIFAAIPMASLVFIFGGVAPKEMIKALVVVSCLAVLLGIFGVFISAWLGRTTWATVASFAFTLLLLVGPVVLYALVGILQQKEPPRWLLTPNPVSALASAVIPAGSPTGALGQLGWVLSGGLSMVRGGRPMETLPRPLYHYTLALWGGAAAVFYLIATRLVRPTGRWRLKWRDVLWAAGTVVVLGGVVTGVFVGTAGRYAKAGAFATPTPFPVMPEMPVSRVEVERIVPGIDAPEDALALDDRAAIYAAVVERLYLVDHTFGSAPDIPITYILTATDDGVGDPEGPQDRSRMISEAVRKQVVERLAESLPTQIVWVDSRDEVPMDEQESVLDGGAVMTLGNIHLQEDGSVLVSASVYFGRLAAGGRTYVVEQVKDTWQVTGDTGAQWIS